MQHTQKALSEMSLQKNDQLQAATLLDHHTFMRSKKAGSGRLLTKMLTLPTGTAPFDPETVPETVTGEVAAELEGATASEMLVVAGATLRGTTVGGTGPM